MRRAAAEAFLTRWQMLMDAVGGVVASAKQTAPQINPLEAARLDVVLKKAVRAREVLQQLQEYSQRQQQLELKYRPVVQQLPALQQQLRPEELSAAAEFALTEGMRQPIMQQVTGSDAAAVSAAQAADPYGIRVALRPGHPLALLTWQQYIATVMRMSKTVEQQLQGPAVEALAAFNRERKLLVHELQALRQQLEQQVEIPQLQPLRDETERLEQLLDAVAQLQDAHVTMLRKDMAHLDLELLELKLKLRAGDAFKGTPVHAALKRLKQLHAMVNASQRLPSAAWQQLDEDLRTLVDSAQQRQKLQQQVDVNVQKHEQAMFRRLAQLQQQLQGPCG
ncbi:hypothetical protein COO60DRAFT_1222554 [Scenedesmus sp. NREL 46B-D3]|nr:hypothetical protein COO60DRAFT_1222554 [Scenedesmus sp. NREL 46B-D3]